MRSLAFLALLGGSVAVNFEWEGEDFQLTDEYLEYYGYDGIAFGDPSKADPAAGPECRAFPGTDSWPSQELTELEMFLEDALLRPSPIAAVCYDNHPLGNEDACRDLILSEGNSRVLIDDPLTVLTQWPQGNSCPLEQNPEGECTMGGFPVYVVNVTAVYQIQATVNFARNHNMRLIIKNTGHDWHGRSSGAGSISVWTHHLKDFEFLPEYTQGEYSGMAARVGAGVEAWEMFEYMAEHNVTFAVPGGTTIGAYGGWMLGGGHNAMCSKYGLGSDQVLSMQVVTADGRFVTADPETNSDLFYAMRGGGPSTFGIVTSAVIKAYPATRMRMTPLAFGTGPDVDLETFWVGVDFYEWYMQYISDSGGTAYDYISPAGNDSYTFTTEIELPGMTDDEITGLLQPLWDSLAELGMDVEGPTPGPSNNFKPHADKGRGDSLGMNRFSSRLYPRDVWDDDDAFATAMAAIRTAVEAGYTFHGIHMRPTKEVAGWPGAESGVNPHFRRTQMHTDLFNSVDDPVGTLDVFKEMTDVIRKSMPGAGAYINEADVEEPDFQHAFFGENYERLLEIKNKVDPWRLFWAQSTVGSEGWECMDEGIEPTQNGPLCKV